MRTRRFHDDPNPSSTEAQASDSAGNELCRIIDEFVPTLDAGRCASQDRTGRLGDSRQLDVPCETYQRQQLDGQVGGVNLPPVQAMTGGGLESVVVVVPALTVSQEGDPPQICGLVAGGVRTVTPDVTGGIHQPGGVQYENGAEETAPHQPAHPAQVVEQAQERDRKDDVISVDPAVNRVLVEIGRPLLVVL